MEHTTHNEKETAAIAEKLAADLKPGDLVFLWGPLGAGKSVFARALIRALCGDPELDVPSPTFTLVQQYDAPGAAIWHFDLYRLEHPEEIYELGWEDALAGGIVLLEWPERLSGILSNPSYIIEIKTGTDNDTRTVIVHQKVTLG